jgi:hypothetical protein
MRPGAVLGVPVVLTPTTGLSLTMTMMKRTAMTTVTSFKLAKAIMTPEDKGANQEAIEDPIEAAIRRSTTFMFRRVHMFSDGAANSLYDDQMITTFNTLRELDDDTIKKTCRAIKKPGGATMGYQISELSVTRFKLFAFWARHMWRT